MSKSKKKQMKEIAEAAGYVRAICHPIRMKILRLLDKQPGKPVTHIYTKLKMEQSIVSQHIKILRNAGLLELERNGKYIYYTVNYARVKRLNKVINGFDYEGS